MKHRIWITLFALTCLVSGAHASDSSSPPGPSLVAGLELRPVGAAVGNVANDGPELIAPAPVGGAAPQRLF